MSVKLTSFFVLLAGLACSSIAATIQTVDNVKQHEVVSASWLKQIPDTAPIKNVILMIGDGMSSEHVWAAWICNGGKLNVETLPYTGFSRTYSANKLVTDSAAGGTALACGEKTNNGMLGQTPQGEHLQSLATVMMAEPYGKKAGLVVTKAITDATPAAFYAHTSSRQNTRKIAAQLCQAGLQVVVGGGADHFTVEQVAALEAVSGAHVLLAAPEHCPYAAERGDMLPAQTRKALRLLEQSPNGFFLMIEGSEIDTASHAKELRRAVEETLDFDSALGEVLAWMKGRTDTLLVVTADHQTGGLVIHGGNVKAGQVKGSYATDNHTGIVVPIYAAGPGASRFTGVMENTEIPRIILQLLSQQGADAELNL